MKATYIVTIENVPLENEASVANEIKRRVFAKAKKVVEKFYLARDEKFAKPTLGERADAAVEKLDEAASTVEELASEMQDWYDNLPDSFRDGEKGEQLSEAQSLLEELNGELTSFDFKTTYGGPKGARVATKAGLSDRIKSILPTPPEETREKIVNLKMTLSSYTLEEVGLRVNLPSLTKAVDGFAGARVSKEARGGSRSSRLYEAKAAAEFAAEEFRAIVEDLKATFPVADASDEPTPADEIVDELIEAADAIDGLDFDSVEFPGMY
jgi:hypothetical protein